MSDRNRPLDIRRMVEQADRFAAQQREQAAASENAAVARDILKPLEPIHNNLELHQITQEPLKLVDDQAVADNSIWHAENRGTESTVRSAELAQEMLATGHEFRIANEIGDP